jgi:hypothetical protein
MTTSTRINKSRRKIPEQWHAIVEDSSASGLSVLKFCIQQNIQYVSFSKWRQRQAINKKIHTDGCSQPASFIDVSSFVNENTSWNITLKLGNGVELVLNQT